MKYVYRAAETYWKNFYALSTGQKESVREAWKLFKVDPFAPQLRPHKINYLSSQAKRNIYAVEIEADLRAVFFIEGNVVFTFDIGKHSVYRE